MRRTLRLLAAAILVAAVGFWLAKGAHWGWNQSKVPKKTLDEVTGIEQVTYEDRFVPGFEFLGETAIATGVLFAASFFLRNKESRKV